MPNTPNINIQNGEVTGTLGNGQPFYWYNPSQRLSHDHWKLRYLVRKFPIHNLPADRITTQQPKLLATPNPNSYAWVEGPNEWTADGGGPHIASETGVYNPPIVSIQTAWSAAAWRMARHLTGITLYPERSRSPIAARGAQPRATRQIQAMTAAAMATEPNEKLVPGRRAPTGGMHQACRTSATPPLAEPKKRRAGKRSRLIGTD